MNTRLIFAKSIFLTAILLFANSPAKCAQKAPPVLAGANCAFWRDYVGYSVKWYSDFYAETGIAFSHRDASIKTTTAIYEKTAYIAGLVDAYNAAGSVTTGDNTLKPRLPMKLKDYVSGVDVFCAKKENSKAPVAEALISVNERLVAQTK